MRFDDRRSRIKFYLDEHVPRAVVRGLRDRGADVLTVAEAGLLGASDEEHLALAVEQGRVIFTHDSDFLRLHGKAVDHAGIVFAPGKLQLGPSYVDLC